MRLIMDRVVLCGPGNDFKKTEPLVSVVTPFFNTADHLAECIQSVLEQTYENWEYILVDNCSTDGSAEIAEKLAASDDRVRLIRETEFVGQVENYNRALRYISPESKYCKIVQADDWIYPQFLAEMVAVAESDENVALVSSFVLLGDRVIHGGLSLSRGPVYSGREAARCQLLGKGLFGSPTNVLYRSDHVRSKDPFYATDVPHCEDSQVCFEILHNRNFGFVPQVLSYSRCDNASTWGGIERYYPSRLHDVMFVHRFGPLFLDAGELAARTCEVEDIFYDVLARGVLRKYGPDFWKFHEQGLRSVGLKIAYPKVFSRVCSIVLDAALNPKRTFETLLRHWSSVKA
jgi:glycosyltransferase involved in cell wall biosynthesis